MDALIWILAAAFSARLSLVDLREHRLPNRLVAWMTAALVAAMTVAVAFGEPAVRLSTAGTAAVQTVAVYAAVYVISRGQFGMGDVKFAVPLGLTMGWFAADLWLTAILAAFGGAAAVSLAMLAMRRLTLQGRIAFGPYMAVTTLLASLAR